MNIMISNPKKLLIVIPSYRWGGDSTALLNLLNRLDTTQYQVDLFPLIDEGPYKERYTNCNLLDSSPALESLLRKFRLKLNVDSIRSLILKTLNVFSRRRYTNLLYRRVGKKLTRKKDYDSIIAWTEWEPTSFVSAIPHKNRIAWIHCDYAFNTHSREEDESYERIDKIVLVSYFCKERFLELFPDLKNRVSVIYDVLDCQLIKQKASEMITDYPHGDGYNLLSFGRIAPGKRFSLIPEMAARLKEAGIVFNWSIMGPNQHPEELKLIQERIESYQVQDCVEYIGTRVNPYPYIKKADVVINTSASEALSYAILESLILGTPTINADFKVAYEVLDDGKNGLIVPIGEMADTIIRFLKDETLRQRMLDYIKVYSYDDERPMHEFELLLS